MVKIPSSVHIRIENALGLRKELLETALIATELLQKYKLYKNESADKIKLITKFKKEITNIKEEVHELEFKDLPKEITKKLQPEKPMIIKTPKELREEETKEEFEEPITKSDLELELEDLKSKIENINI